MQGSKRLANERSSIDSIARHSPCESGEPCSSAAPAPPPVRKTPGRGNPPGVAAAPKNSPAVTPTPPRKFPPPPAGPPFPKFEYSVFCSRSTAWGGEQIPFFFTPRGPTRDPRPPI